MSALNTSHVERRLLRKRFKAIALPIMVLIFFLAEAVHFVSLNRNLGTYFPSFVSDFDQPKQSYSLGLNFPSLLPVPKTESFGACLMVKGDNDLLSEWIPYHYTILPLRYLVVVTDTDNGEDPTSILEKWTTAHTGLHWWLFNVSEFESIHEEFDAEGVFQSAYRKFENKERTQSNDTIHLEAFQEFSHKKLVHKQNAMITHCTKFMKEKGVRWTSLYDTDEFLVVNRIGTDERVEESSNTTARAESLDETYGSRPRIPPMESNATVVDIIHSFQKAKKPLKSCQLLPRVSFGAIENITCPGSEAIKAFARKNFNYQGLSTLRYQQHAVKTDFKKNRFGKVFVDVSNISDDTLSRRPRNIHRPFSNECKRPIAPVQESPFYLMHYAGGWERFRSKNDTRRGYRIWKELADVSDSTSCCQQEAYRWLPRFVDQVGLRRAKFLLG